MIINDPTIAEIYFNIYFETFILPSHQITQLSLITIVNLRLKRGSMLFSYRYLTTAVTGVVWLCEELKRRDLSSVTR